MSGRIQRNVMDSAADERTFSLLLIGSRSHVKLLAGLETVESIYPIFYNSFDVSFFFIDQRFFFFFKNVIRLRIRYLDSIILFVLFECFIRSRVIRILQIEKEKKNDQNTRTLVSYPCNERHNFLFSILRNAQLSV